MSAESERRRKGGWEYFKLLLIPLVLVTMLCQIVIEYYEMGFWSGLLLRFVALVIVNYAVYFVIYRKRLVRNG